MLFSAVDRRVVHRGAGRGLTLRCPLGQRLDAGRGASVARRTAALMAGCFADQRAMVRAAVYLSARRGPVWPPPVSGADVGRSAMPAWPDFRTALQAGRHFAGLLTAGLIAAAAASRGVSKLRGSPGSAPAFALRVPWQLTPLGCAMLLRDAMADAGHLAVLAGARLGRGASRRCRPCGASALAVAVVRRCAAAAELVRA